MNKYSIGYICYNDSEYSNAAEYCNTNNLILVEVEPDEKGRRFEIQEIPQATIEELNKDRIDELKQKLFDTDYQAIKYAEGLIATKDYSEIKLQRQSWRDEINLLETGSH